MRKQNWKNSYGFWKINEFIWYEKNNRVLNFLFANIFIHQFLHNVSVISLQNKYS